MEASGPLSQIIAFRPVLMVGLTGGIMSMASGTGVSIIRTDVA
jgi:hypothetical protein